MADEHGEQIAKAVQMEDARAAMIKALVQCGELKSEGDAKARSMSLQQLAAKLDRARLDAADYAEDGAVKAAIENAAGVAASKEDAIGAVVKAVADATDDAEYQEKLESHKRKAAMVHALIKAGKEESADDPSVAHIDADEAARVALVPRLRDSTDVSCVNEDVEKVARLGLATREGVGHEHGEGVRRAPARGELFLSGRGGGGRGGSGGRGDGTGARVVGGSGSGQARRIGVGPRGGIGARGGGARGHRCCCPRRRIVSHRLVSGP